MGHCTLDSGSCPTTPGAGRTQYGYDGEGRRVTKTSQTGGTIVYVYDAQGRLVAEYGGTAAGSGVQYLTADHLGSIRVITDPSKTVLECNDNLPFGDEILATSQNGRSGIACYAGETGLRQRATGKERGGAFCAKWRAEPLQHPKKTKNLCAEPDRVDFAVGGHPLDNATP